MTGSRKTGNLEGVGARSELPINANHCLALFQGGASSQYRVPLRRRQNI